MSPYRHGSHSIYQCHYHFVFIPKYRKPVLRGEVGVRLRELVREICKSHDIVILKGHVRPDHVHLLLSVPPTLSPSRVMNAIKGKSPIRLLREFRTLAKAFWGRHLWARGYFVATSGNVINLTLEGGVAAAAAHASDETRKRFVRSSGYVKLGAR